MGLQSTQKGNLLKTQWAYSRNLSRYDCIFTKKAVTRGFSRTARCNHVAITDILESPRGLWNKSAGKFQVGHGIANLGLSLQSELVQFLLVD